jgi:tyrosinase
VFERCDVWELGSEEDPWHPIIEWYARAVTAMQERNGTDFSDPTCWRYLAEVHGSSIPRGDWPRGATWNECQHSSWYFLP